MPERPAPYRPGRVALLTRHGKEAVLAAVLEPALGCSIVHVSSYDTDQLGSFTREIPRAGTQLDAARTKARIGMRLAGLPLGIASEGAFGVDPVSGLMPWNRECLIWLDDTRQLEVVGHAQGPACHAHRLAHGWPEVRAFAEQVGFPDQYLVVRPEHRDDPRVSKDIGNWAALADAVERARAQSASGAVFVETDGRAHANPMRRVMIRRAAEDLLARLVSACPNCGQPGFGAVATVPGLPCGACGAPTR